MIWIRSSDEVILYCLIYTRSRGLIVNWLLGNLYLAVLGSLFFLVQKSKKFNTSQHGLVKVRSDLGLVRVSKQLIAITMNFKLTFYCFLWIVPSSNYAIISFQFDLVFKNFLYIFIYFISFLVWLYLLYSNLQFVTIHTLLIVFLLK